MNLTKLFEAQKELDDRIAAEHPPETGEDRLAKKILALQVELGECANEWRGFKFWSKDQKPHGEQRGFFPDGSKVKNPLLEEFVDCLHFILSIGLDIGAVDRANDLNEYLEFIEESGECDSTTAMFNALFDKVGDFSLYKTISNYASITDRFTQLGKMLGFTWEQVEAAYFEKNQINHNRQATGY